MNNLKGTLLISSGGLYDSSFRHTVVLVGEHESAAGAVGVILNRPMEPTVDRAVPALAGLVSEDAPLYEGGPVASDEVVILVETEDPGELDLPIFGSVGFLTGEVAGEVRASIRKARIFLGHAGWGPGQLESEMDAGAWIVEDATSEDVFTGSPLTLWHDLLKRKGPPYDVMARIPFDPTMN